MRHSNEIQTVFRFWSVPLCLQNLPWDFNVNIFVGNLFLSFFFFKETKKLTINEFNFNDFFCKSFQDFQQQQQQQKISKNIHTGKAIDWRLFCNWICKRFSKLSKNIFKLLQKDRLKWWWWEYDFAEWTDYYELIIICFFVRTKTWSSSSSSSDHLIWIKWWFSQKKENRLIDFTSLIFCFVYCFFYLFSVIGMFIHCVTCDVCVSGVNQNLTD